MTAVEQVGMDRIDAGLLVVALASVALGGTVAADFSDRLQSFGAADFVAEQVTTEVTDARVADQRLYLDVQVRNPTRYDLRLTGVFVRAFNGTDSRLAWGSATLSGDGSGVVPAGGSLRTRLALRLTPAQADALRAALRADGFEVTGRQSFRLGETQLTVPIAPTHVPAAAQTVAQQTTTERTPEERTTEER